VLRVVHRKALLEALAEELPMETIRFSSNLTSITIQAQERSSPHVALIKMEDGTTINANVRTIHFLLHKMHKNGVPRNHLMSIFRQPNHPSWFASPLNDKK
jgi:hypothetical protein